MRALITLALFALAILLFVLSAGCATVPTVKTVCPPLTPYTAAQEQQLAVEIAALPPGSVLVQAMGDYGAMRAAVRKACP